MCTNKMKPDSEQEKIAINEIAYSGIGLIGHKDEQLIPAQYGLAHRVESIWLPRQKCPSC